MCRFEAVSPLPLNSMKSDGRYNPRVYQASYEGKPAVVKILVGNHDSALVHQKWAENGLAPELWASEPVMFNVAETGIYMARSLDSNQNNMARA